MIVSKTYLNRCNTLVKDSPVNLSLNPIMELNYGKMLTRGIIYFDHTKIKNMVEDKIYPDTNKLHHILKMTNAASITSNRINKPCLTSEYNDKKERALSFDIILFKLPVNWDDGRGFDYVYDLDYINQKSISVYGSNWYQYRNYCKWQNEGIYDIDYLFKQYDLFTNKNGNLSEIIIASQHFEYGNENIEIDITDYFNKLINEEEVNYGIGIAFAPYFENLSMPKSQYVGFFTQHTNSFFEPYVETRYDEYIKDDRTNFYLDKDNKLYFYASVSGSNVNLDELPTCTIEGCQKAVKQASKGIYYIDINLSSEDYEEDVMLYDIWDNIKYKGKQFKPVELNFVTKLSEDYFSFGVPTNNTNDNNKEIIPTLYGIDENERIKRGDIRKINVDCRIPFTSDRKYSVDGLSYRLYVKQGERQIDVIEWTTVEIGYNENYFLINTNDLIPSRYFIDIKIQQNNEIINKTEMLQFDIVNDATKVYN